MKKTATVFVKEKFHTLHKEYDMNRVHFTPITEDDIKVSMAKGKSLGLIDVESYRNFNKFMFPFVSYIDSTTYPEQNEDFVGQTFRLWYKDESINEVESGEFEVVRWDNESPYRIMLKNDVLGIILVSTDEYVLDDGTGQVDELGRAVSNVHVHQVPLQMGELLGLEVRDHYNNDEHSNIGTIIRVDAGGEFPQCVILEELNENEYRLLTLEETHSVVCLYDIGVECSTNFWPTDWRNLKYETTAPGNETEGENETE